MGDSLLTTRKLSNHFGKVCTARDLDLSFEQGVLTSILGRTRGGEVHAHQPPHGAPSGAGRADPLQAGTSTRLPSTSGSAWDLPFVPGRQRLPRVTYLQNVLIPVSLGQGNRGGRSGASRGRPRSCGRRKRSLRRSPCWRSATPPPPRCPMETFASSKSAWRSPPPRRCCFSTSPPPDESRGAGPPPRKHPPARARGRTTFVWWSTTWTSCSPSPRDQRPPTGGDPLATARPGRSGPTRKCAKCTWATTLSDLFRYAEE